MMLIMIFLSRGMDKTLIFFFFFKTLILWEEKLLFFVKAKKVTIINHKVDNLCLYHLIFVSSFPFGD